MFGQKQRRKGQIRKRGNRQNGRKKGIMKMSRDRKIESTRKKKGKEERKAKWRERNQKRNMKRRIKERKAREVSKREKKRATQRNIIIEEMGLAMNTSSATTEGLLKQ